MNAVKKFITENSFLVLIGIAILFGYIFGKDRALRDNTPDLQTVAAENVEKQEARKARSN